LSDNCHFFIIACINELITIFGKLIQLAYRLKLIGNHLYHNYTKHYKFNFLANRAYKPFYRNANNRASTKWKQH